jgi:hypothetical protein
MSRERAIAWVPSRSRALARAVRRWKVHGQGRTLGLLLSLWLGWAMMGRARAEEASFTAQLSAQEITLDDRVQLTITLGRDARETYRGYSRPDFRDFDVLHQGQAESTQWSAAGGQQSVRIVEQHIYLLKPRHKGVCVIPVAVARLGARELRTSELKVTVRPAGKRPTGPLASPSPGLGQGLPLDPFGAGLIPVPESMRGDEDLFIEARADKSSVYLGEPVVISWWIYTQSDILRYRSTSEPKHDDFWSEDLFVPSGPLGWDRAEVKGRSYQAALLLKRALFPLKSGRLTVTPLEAEVTTLQSAFYPSGSVVRGSRPVVVEVRPLPASGRPEGFEPTNVGRFEIEASVDRDHIKADESLTLKVTVRGEGNIRNVRLRKLDRIAGFRVYEPATSERVEHTSDGVRGERVYTYLLQPELGGDLVLPAVTLAYFDPQERHYGQARSSPIAVHVEGDPRQLLQAKNVRSNENILSSRVRLLRNKHHLSSRLGERILRGPILVAALAVPPGLMLTLLAGTAVRSVLRRETEGRKRRRARAAARRRLRTAEGYIKAQRPTDFFAECVRAIYEHLEFRLGVKCEALTLGELQQLLLRRGVDEQLATQLVDELESSDFARFAPSASGAAEMREALRRVRGLLAAIERARVQGEAA